jgi:hypothetical protein
VGAGGYRRSKKAVSAVYAEKGVDNVPRLKVASSAAVNLACARSTLCLCEGTAVSGLYTKGGIPEAASLPRRDIVPADSFEHRDLKKGLVKT